MGRPQRHCVVASTVDLPEHCPIRGQVGTIVESWTSGVFEVEFSHELGGTYALVALPADQRMRLHHGPLYEAS